MTPFHEYLDEYSKQMKKGNIREAYKGLMEYIMGLDKCFRPFWISIVQVMMFVSYAMKMKPEKQSRVSAADKPLNGIEPGLGTGLNL
jgi:hypothetical protein